MKNAIKDEKVYKIYKQLRNKELKLSNELLQELEEYLINTDYEIPFCVN